MDSPVTHGNTGHSWTPGSQKDTGGTGDASGHSRHLSSKHLCEIVEGSGVSAELVEGRYFTVTADEAIALGFSEKQAAAGWIVELLSPTGEVSYQLKRDHPRLVKEKGKLKAIKYETPCGRDCIVDVHPSNMLRLLNTLEDLWVVEGAKKGDCAASRGRLALVLTGVWNWGKKRRKSGVKYGKPELLPDWEAMPLEGRKVFIAFDADYRSKRSVAQAMMRLAERLTELGAHVYIISLPGPEKGLDDYVVSGGDLEDLKRAATRFEAGDFTRYVSTQDRQVQKAVELARRRMSLDLWAGKAGKTDHSHLGAVLELTLERGKWTGGIVEVIAPTREMQERSGIGSRATLGKSDARLEERGYFTKVPGDRAKGNANRYILNLSKLNHVLGGGEEVTTAPTPGSVMSDFVPHLRWAAPPPPEDEPRRGPKTPMYAVGKPAELAIHRLLSWDGSATISDLAAGCGYSDPYKFRERVLEDIAEFGVVILSEKGKHSGRVSLSPDWRERLNDRREAGGEFATARLQAAKHRKERETFHSPAAADPTPDLPTPEEVERLLGEAAERDEASQIEEQRRKVGTTATVFVHDLLTGLGRVRLELLKELWAERGGNPTHVWRAVRRLGYKVERFSEYGNALFVFPPTDFRAA